MGRVVEGDCLEVMRGMEENSVDAVVCDPPYALGFMGKAWDRFPTDKGPKKPFANQSKESKLGGHPFQKWCQSWAAECLRIAKPGAYLLAFGGTRTFHRLACAIEDAGWVLKDTLSWNYGSGFPKSKNIALAIDKGEGHPNRGRAVPTASHFQNASTKHLTGNPVPDYEAKSEAAKEWGGYGTALKPAWEPIILAQAPLQGTYAENVLKWGCGALNIDACRVGNAKGLQRKNDSVNMFGVHNEGLMGTPDGKGRWPANFLLSHSLYCEDGNCVPDCPVRMLDEQSGNVPGGFNKSQAMGIMGSKTKSRVQVKRTCDQGGASRFFYCAKASRSERNAGLEELNALFEKREGFEERVAPKTSENIGRRTSLDKRRSEHGDAHIRLQNNHPTVKPIALLRYLCRLITPPGGVVLDPFAGSGSTGCAAALEGFEFIGIEKEKGYVEIARARISHFSQGRA